MSAGFRIESLTAFVCVDEDGDEGVIGERTPQGWVPFVAADEDRIRALFPRARQIAEASGLLVKLVRFGAREELAVVAPEGAPTS